MIPLRWSPQARREFWEIYHYLEQNDPHLAEKFAFNVYTLLEKVQKFPLMGRMVPELMIQTIREVFYKRYRIIYRYQNEIIEIITIFHSSREFPL
jgi:toxin ParE1/3/4